MEHSIILQNHSFFHAKHLHHVQMTGEIANNESFRLASRVCNCFISNVCINVSTTLDLLNVMNLNLNLNVLLPQSLWRSETEDETESESELDVGCESRTKADVEHACNLEYEIEAEV